MTRQLSGKVEYHFPLFSISSADFRALVFYDVSAVWFRDLPPSIDPSGSAIAFATRPTPAPSFPSTQQGFSPGRDIHNDVGAGFRFFLRSVAIPLVGFDAGYGIEARHWRFMVVIGA